MLLLCVMFGLDGKWDEDNLCELLESVIILLREFVEVVVFIEVGI